MAKEPAHKKPTRRGPGQPPISPNDPLRSTNVLLPQSFFKRIEALVKTGICKNQSDALRKIVELGLKRLEKN